MFYGSTDTRKTFSLSMFSNDRFYVLAEVLALSLWRVHIEAEPAQTLEGATIANRHILVVYPPVSLLYAHLAKVLELVLRIEYAVRHSDDVV